jgi:cell division protein ZapA
LKRSVAVTIAGQRISLKSDADDAYVQLLADTVDGRMRELQKRSQKAGVAEVAVLAALQLADDLFRAERRRADLRKKVRAGAERIIDELSTRSGNLD